MVYDATMLEAFYTAYKGKVEHVRSFDVGRKNTVCPFV